MPDDQRQAIAEMFDRTAVTYDNVGVEFFQPIADHLVEELAPRPGERVLDIGCGRGAVLFLLARAVGKTGAVTGIDLSQRMVETTRAEATALGLTVDVRLGDAMEPDLKQRSFDAIASSLVLFFLPDPGAALRNWRRLLVPGGRLGMSTFGEVCERWHPVDEVFQPFAPKGMRSSRSPDAESPFASDAGVEQLLREAGFRSVRTERITVAVRFDDEDQWHRWTWSVAQRRLWEAVPPDRRDEVRAAAYRVLDRCRGADGRIGFEQAARFTLGIR